jgi:hypothetical protein
MLIIILGSLDIGSYLNPDHEDGSFYETLTELNLLMWLSAQDDFREGMHCSILATFMT